MYVSSDEQILKNNQTIDLENVVSIYFHNLGSFDVSFGLKVIKPSEVFVFDNSGNINITQQRQIKFTNGQSGSGELYVDIKRFVSCKNK